MSRSFHVKPRVLLGMAAAVFSGMLLFGCGSDDGPAVANPNSPSGPSGPSGGGETQNALTLSSGEAWIFGDNPDEGRVFTSNQRIYKIQKFEEVWETLADDTGTYTVSGGNLVSMDYGAGDPRNGIYTFKITGDTLTLSRTGVETQVFIKTRGVSPAKPGLNGSLVLADSMVWASGGATEALVFTSSTRVMSILFDHYDEADGSISYWTAAGENTYTARDGNISIGSTTTRTGTYAFSRGGKTLTLTLNGDKKTFDAWEHAVIVIPPIGSSLVLPPGKAWAYSTANGKKEGYMFVGKDENGRVFKIDYGYADRGWRAEQEGYYDVYDASTVRMTWNDNSETYAEFAFSKDTLRFTIGNKTTAYAVASGVDLPTSPSNGGDIALPVGYAWTYTTDGRTRREGYIFLPDKRVFVIDSGINNKTPWTIRKAGSYYITGDGTSVNIVWKGETRPIAVTYTASGNALVLAGMEYTKTPGVNIEDIQEVVNNLAFPTNQVIQGWTRPSEYGDGTSKEGYIFLTDGRAFSVDSIDENGWRLRSSVAMKYETTGYFVAITRNVYMNSWVTEYYSYVIANGGNTLTMTSNYGNESVYTKTYGINVTIPPLPAASKSRAGISILKAFAKK